MKYDKWKATNIVNFILEIFEIKYKAQSSANAIVFSWWISMINCTLMQKTHIYFNQMNFLCFGNESLGGYCQTGGLVVHKMSDWSEAEGFAGRRPALHPNESPSLFGRVRCLVR